MGIGTASGENRAVEAAKMAIASPLLELSIDGAKGILFTVTGSPDLAMYEVAEAAKVITGSADDDAKVIFGANIDETLKDEVRITVVATGFDGRERRSAPNLAGDVEIAPQGSWSPAPRKEAPSYFSAQPIRQQQHAEPEASPFETRRVPTVKEEAPKPMPKPAPKPAAEEEDDLGIPAFIRRKMM